MDIVMPSLGADMEEGSLIEWSVKVGDRVHKGDIVAVIETVKGAVDMEVYEDGVISELLFQPVISLPVGTVIARMDQVSDKVAAKANNPVPVETALSGEKAADEVPANRILKDRARQLVSPAVRKKSLEMGLDLSQIKGSGINSAVLLRDLSELGATTKARAAKAAGAGFDVTGMRNAIAVAMEKSKREIPHYYLSMDIDISHAVAYLKETNEQRAPEQRLLLLAILLRATAKSLIQYPQLNGYFEAGTFKPGGNVHIGNAITLRGGGLVVPAIHSVNALSLDETMSALQDMITRSRSGHLRSSELTEATITVTNIGDRGCDAVFGVIYPPQVAIIGFGRPRQVASVVDNNVVIRSVVTTTLSADHRVSDGTVGARFLNTLSSQLQQPGDL